MSDAIHCEHTASVALFALQALSSDDAARMADHIAGCATCRAELDALAPVVDTFVAWRTNVLRPPRPLWDRLAQRIAKDKGSAPVPAPVSAWREPEWEAVAPGISCKLLATAEDRVSMLVRLEPRTAYPPHRHAGIEELHLLEGELWIDDRKLYPGDYNRGEPGAADQRVYSETGCTCVLITSPRDVLG